MTLTVGIYGSPTDREGLDYVLEAERLGAETVWTAEYWGHDAITPLAALANVTSRIRLGTAIVQLGSRTPAMLAMSAMSMQQLSGGRFLLGVGASGPQVMEGWHGVTFDKPVTRTRDTIEIIRRITAGERLEFEGELHQLPLPGGEGKALRSAAAAVDVPVYIASLGPANLALTGAMADGWIGNSFFCRSADVFFDPIRKGAEAVGRSIDDIDLTVSVSCEITDDVEEAGRRHASGFAFTFGAMGSKASNFYNNAFARQGWGDDVAEVQRLWLAGDHQAAAARVPVGIGLGTNLIGPPDEIRRRLREYRACGVNALRLSPMGDSLDQRLDGLGQLLDVVRDVNDEAVTAHTDPQT